MHADVVARAGRGARFVGGGFRSAIDHDDHFPVVGLPIEIRADVRHRAADAAGFVVGGDHEAQLHYSSLTLPSLLIDGGVERRADRCGRRESCR